MKKTEKIRLILIMISIFCLIDGILCFVLKGATVNYIDMKGVIHENFFFLPIGYGLIFLSIILSVIAIVYKNKKNNGNKEEK